MFYRIVYPVFMNIVRVFIVLVEKLFAIKTTELVLFFHKKTTKQVFSLAQYGLNKHQSVNILI